MLKELSMTVTGKQAASESLSGSGGLLPLTNGSGGEEEGEENDEEVLFDVKVDGVVSGRKNMTITVRRGGGGGGGGIL